MGDVSRQQLAVYVAAAIAIALIGARYLKEAQTTEPEASARRAPQLRLERSGSGSYVHVTGAVRRPGVYRLPGWARLELAVRRAGGAAAGADLQAVNLAARVTDGQQVVVPRRARAGTTAAASAAQPGAAGPISLNTATEDQLDELDGIGPTTAQKILDWRKQHGGFASVEDLKQISGIGPKRFESLKDKVGM